MYIPSLRNIFRHKKSAEKRRASRLQLETLEEERGYHGDFLLHGADGLSLEGLGLDMGKRGSEAETPVWKKVGLIFCRNFLPHL